MRNKIIFITAAVISAALLFGGLFLLFRDDVGEMIQEEKIKPYVPDFTLLELLEDNDQEEENTADIPAEAEEKLKEQTQELCANVDNSIGWINVPETKIDYPVMYSGDNEFYLHRAVDGSYLRVGSIFLDYRCNAGFTGKINVLYGHNMSDGSMFADVKKFTDNAFFNSHRYGWLTSENEVFCVQFFAVDQTENTGEIYDTNADWRTVMSEVVNRAVIYDDIEIADTDRLLMLSTCTGADSGSRTILVGKIMEDHV